MDLATRMAEAKYKKTHVFGIGDLLKHETTPTYFGQWVEQVKKTIYFARTS